MQFGAPVRAGPRARAWRGQRRAAPVGAALIVGKAQFGSEAPCCFVRAVVAHQSPDHKRVTRAPTCRKPGQNPRKIPSESTLSAKSAKSMFASDRFATIGSTSEGVDRNVRPTCSFNSLKSTNSTV